MRKANEIDDFDDEEEYSEEEDDIDFEHDNQDHSQLHSPSSTIINSIASTIPITSTTTTSTSISSETNIHQTATMKIKTVNEKSSSSRLLARCLYFFYSFSLLPRYIHM